MIMKRSSFLFAALLALSIAAGCSKGGVKYDYPLFWTWANYRSGDNFDSLCTVINQVGIDGVVLNCDTPEEFEYVIPIAHAHGIKVFSSLCTLNPENEGAKLMKEHPEWLSVNRLGQSLADTRAYVDHYRFLCPALPEVREYLCDMVRAQCEIEGLDGISIDFHRFVDVILPTTMWQKYNVVQDWELPEFDYGYHPEMIRLFKENYGYDPREQEDPSMDEKWVQFRCDQITGLANIFADIVHSYGKVMAASPFPTPKIARRMVRQEWGKWNLDIVFPMVYYLYYTQDPSFCYDCMVENVRDKNPGSTLYCGIKYREDIVPAMDEAIRGGAQGIAIFNINLIDTPEKVAEIRAYTDSVKAVAAANGGKLPAVKVPEAADTDFFAHEEVMSKIQERMKEITGADELQLGEYDFVGKGDLDYNYEVSDALSGVSFVVTMYLCGDVFYGWNVTAK